MNPHGWFECIDDTETCGALVRGALYRVEEVSGPPEFCHHCGAPDLAVKMVSHPFLWCTRRFRPVLPIEEKVSRSLLVRDVK